MKPMPPELTVPLIKVGWFKERDLSVLLPAEFRCGYCGQDLLATFTECFNAQLDHIIPRSKGGGDEESNLAACCITCNALKWDYSPVGENRAARIADAARYISAQRGKQERFWLKYRELMGR